MNEIPTDNLINQLVEAANARNGARIDELSASSVEADFLPDAATPGARFDEFFLDSPYTVLSRAEIGPEPVAAVWTFPPDGSPVLAGYIEVEAADDVIVRLEYVPETPEDMLAEEPETPWVASQSFEELDQDDLVAGT